MLQPACDVIPVFDDRPAYLRIDSFILAENTNADAGSLSHNIVDAWVFIDDEMIGIFELPATIPILEDGSRKLTVGPGILNSTISSFRQNYPFYTAFEIEEFELIRDETVSVTPISRYRNEDPSYTYTVVEDFETSVITIDSFGSSDVDLERTQEAAFVFEGNGSGIMSLDENTATARFRTPSYNFPSGGKPSFVEIDYYSDFSFVVGVRVNNFGVQSEIVDYLTLKPTTDGSSETGWKKAYVDISTITNDSPNAIDYFIYFDVLVADPADREKGQIIVDNIKFIHQR